MSGIGGWFNMPHNPESAAVLVRMQAALHGETTEAATAEECRHALGVSRSSTPTGTYRDNELLVAWQGWPGDPGGGADPGGHIAHLYRQHGREFLQYLPGPCALALIDHRNELCMLAIDRLGIFTLYYTQREEGVVFASTPTAVLAHTGIGDALDRQSIFNYLYFHVVPAPRSIYAEVERLTPGQCLTLDHGHSELRYYWQAPYFDTGAASPAAQAEEFRVRLQQAVQRCAEDDKVGAFLSGGTDSSTVAGMLSRVRGAPVDTYSIGFDAVGFDETSYAKIAARHFGSRYHEYYVTPEDVCRAIPLLAAAYDEPFGNASAVPAYYCARLAADDGMHTLLAGDGGDEIFAGNARYAKQKIFELYGEVPAVMRHTLLEPLAFNLPGAALLPPLRKLRSYIEQARVPLPDRLESYNFLHQHDMRQIFTDEFLADIDSEEPLRSLREIYQRTASNDSVNRMMHVDLKITLADNDLRKVNRTAELAGIRVRYPLLDEQLVEFAGRVPASLKLKGYQLRYFFKDALKDFLPPEIIKKSKHGFGLPFGLWMHQHAPLRELAYDSLASFKQRGYLRPAYLGQLVTLHRDQHSTYYGTMIWVLMMLEQWLQVHRR